MSSESIPGTPLEFSDVDVVLNPSVETESEQTSWPCSTCNKTLQTRAGFIKHSLLHRLKGVTDELHQSLQVYLHPIMEEILAQIKTEPSPDEDFKMISNVILNTTSSKFSNFLLELSSRVINIILERKNILLNRFVEECQQSCFVFLASDDEFSELLTQLKFIVGNSYSDNVLNVFLFRVCSLFIEKCLAAVLRLMRGEEEADCDINLAFNDDRAGFLEKCGEILRSLLKGGLASKNSSLWNSRAEVFCHRFVCRSTLITTNDFLNEFFWDGEDEDLKVSLSNDAINFFVGLERIVKLILHTKGQVTLDDVWDVATKPGNCCILDSMSSLTEGYLSEDNVIEIFYDIMKCFIFISCDLEAKSIRAEYDSKGNLNVVALRTNLKRNAPKSKS